MMYNASNDMYIMNTTSEITLDITLYVTDRSINRTVNLTNGNRISLHTEKAL